MQLHGWQWPIGIAAFVAELVLFAGIGLATYQWAGRGLVAWAFGAIVVLLAVGFWSLWMAPRAVRRLPAVPRALIAAVVAVATGFVLSGYGATTWALALWICAAILVLAELTLKNEETVARRIPTP